MSLHQKKKKKNSFQIIPVQETVSTVLFFAQLSSILQDEKSKSIFLFSNLVVSLERHTLTGYM